MKDLNLTQKSHLLISVELRSFYTGSIDLPAQGWVPSQAWSFPSLHPRPTQDPQNDIALASIRGETPWNCRALSQPIPSAEEYNIFQADINLSKLAPRCVRSSVCETHMTQSTRPAHDTHKNFPTVHLRATSDEVNSSPGQSFQMIPSRGPGEHLGGSASNQNLFAPPPTKLPLSFSKLKSPFLLGGGEGAHSLDQMLDQPGRNQMMPCVLGSNLPNSW